jgi:hypothetical protein
MCAQHALGTLVFQERPEQGRGGATLGPLDLGTVYTREPISFAARPKQLEAAFPMEKSPDPRFICLFLLIGPAQEDEAPEELLVAPSAARQARDQPIAQLLPHGVQAERIGRPRIVVL